MNMVLFLLVRVFLTNGSVELNDQDFLLLKDSGAVEWKLRGASYKWTFAGNHILLVQTVDALGGTQVCEKNGGEDPPSDEPAKCVEEVLKTLTSMYCDRGPVYGDLEPFKELVRCFGQSLPEQEP